MVSSDMQTQDWERTCVHDCTATTGSSRKHQGRTHKTGREGWREGWRGKSWGGARGWGRLQVSLRHLQCGMDDFFHRGEVSGPQKLGLLPQGENPRRRHFTESSQDLEAQREEKSRPGVGPCLTPERRKLTSELWEWGASSDVFRVTQS